MNGARLRRGGSGRRAPWLRCGLLVAIVALAACRIEKTPVAEATSATQAFDTDQGFDPDAMVAADWESHIIPDLNRKAGPYDAVASAIAANAAAAGDRYGFREAQAGAPWTYAARIDGVVTAANTESRAATLDVSTDGGRTVTLQIGPVVRGTAIRDSVTTRPFGSFKNQIDYAQYGKALNLKANTVALSALPRDGIVGRRIEALGVFTAPTGGAPPLVTPVELHLEPKA